MNPAIRMLAAMALTAEVTACKAQVPSALELSKFVGPPPGVTVVLRSEDAGQGRWTRHIRGLSSSSQGRVSVEEQILAEDSSMLSTVQYELAVTGDQLMRQNADGSQEILVQGPLRKGSPEWQSEGLLYKPGEPPQSRRLASDCTVVTVSTLPVSDGQRKAITVRCTTGLPDKSKAIQFSDFAEGFGLVGSTTEMVASNGESEGVVRWRLEKIGS